MSKFFRHNFLQRIGVILITLLSFANARFTEAWHFHVPAPEAGQFLKSISHQNAVSQESCPICHAAHLDIISFKAFHDFFFVKKPSSLPFFKEVFKTSFTVTFTSSRAPPALFKKFSHL
ncbi:MAG: hypothetical protein V4642_06910 [Bacteroidota bacterium]